MAFRSRCEVMKASTCSRTSSGNDDNGHDDDDDDDDDDDGHGDVLDMAQDDRIHVVDEENDDVVADDSAAP